MIVDSCMRISVIGSGHLGTIHARLAAQQSDITLVGIATGQPVVEPITAVITFILLGDDITTGAPVVGSLAINASRRRAVHVSALSNNVAAVTDGPNYCIVSANTPNAVIVAETNEAA